MPPRIYLSPPHMSPRERELLGAAFDSNWIAPLGPEVEAFEREFAGKLGVRDAAALASGTAALHLALIMLGVGAGDVVLVPTLTFTATANVVRYQGAEPVFVDSERATWNMDPDLLAEELEESRQRGKMPKAVIAVDLYGQCADYERIEPICRQYGVPLIEDAAEALGATFAGRPAGTFGEIGCFSFNGNKIITTSGGGMLVAASPDLCRQARFLASQAKDPAPHYEHSYIGYNYRLSNLLAAVGRGQLEWLDARVDSRRANFAYYEQAFRDLPGITMMPEHPRGRATRWLTCILIDAEAFGATPEQVRVALEAENIEARPLWKPMHMQPVFARCRVRNRSVSESLFAQGLCLPSGSSLTQADRQRVVDVIRSLNACTGCVCKASEPTPALLLAAHARSDRRDSFGTARQSGWSEPAPKSKRSAS